MRAQSAPARYISPTRVRCAPSFVPGERFAFLRTQLGASFIAIELDDDHANPDAVLAPHSVLTEHLIDEPGQPTRQALDSVLDHFRTRLLAATGHNG